MRRPSLVALVALILALAGCQGSSQEPADEAPADEAVVPAEPDGVPFLALHLYNPASDEAHQQFLGLLSELNAAVLSTGLSDTQYRVWKVIGDQSGEHGYLFGSIWADRAAYDTVHAHPAYQAVMEQYRASGMEPFASEVYNRYLLLNPAPDAGADADGVEPTYLSFHLVNLASAEEEARLLDILEAGNAVVASAGHPETRYGLWKVTGEQTGDYAYMFGSLWADVATYDAVHALPEYEAFVAENGDAYAALVAGEVYNRYEPVDLP